MALTVSPPWRDGYPSAEIKFQGMVLKFFCIVLEKAREKSKCVS